MLLLLTHNRPQFRVVGIACVSIVWKTYVTLVEHADTPDVERHGAVTSGPLAEP